MTLATSLSTRIVDAAAAMTVADGWAQVTMGRVADRAGVSRQTVYNEFGNKHGLAEAVVMTELGRFLDVVRTAFEAQPADLVEAIRGACRGVLEYAADNALLHAAISASHGADTGLLPLLTTRSDTLLASADAVVHELVRGYDHDLDESELPGAIDVIVRVILSHVMQPSGTPEQTADTVAMIAGRVLHH